MSTCTGPAVPRSCPPALKRTPSHRARHFWPPRLRRSECFCLRILFPLTRLDVKSEPGGTSAPSSLVTTEAPLGGLGSASPRSTWPRALAVGSAGAASGKPCRPVQTCLPRSWLVFPGSEGGASGGSSGPQSQMWPWRDGVEAGVGGHADRACFRWKAEFRGNGTRHCCGLRGPA